MSFQELIAPRREANPPLSVYSCASAYDKIKSRAHCYGNEMRSLKWNLISWVLLETMSTASDKRKRTRRILSLLMLFSKQEKSACVLCACVCIKSIYSARQTEWENEKLTGTVCSGRRLRLHTTGNTYSALTTRSKGRCRVARPAPQNVQGCILHCSPAFCGERVEFCAASDKSIMFIPGAI